MRVLVTGASGFVGSHLLRELEAHDHTPIPLADPGDETNPLSVDITAPEALQALIQREQPDACIHLAGIAFVPTCRDNPELALNVNTGGTLNLLEAFRHHAPAARIVVVATSEVYGRHAFDGPVDEDTPLRPTNVYGATKVAADQLTRLYADLHGMHTLVARPENHIGPGQSEAFVASAFARQVGEALKAGKGVAHLLTGNLESKRDFTDVRDTVRAYRLLLESGTPGKAYNVASGQLTRIGALLEYLAQAAGIEVTQETDPALFRPTDCSPEISVARLRADTGWEPRIPLATTAADILAEQLDVLPLHD